MKGKKSVGRPTEIGVIREKMVRVYASVRPETRDLIDKLVAANSTRENRDRSSWIANAIMEKLRRKKRAKQGENS